MKQIKRVITGGAIAALVTASALAAPATGASASPGQSVTDLASGVTATQLAQQLTGSGISISNATYTGDPHAAGSFSGLGATGIPAGIALSSGSVSNNGDHVSSILGPNTSDGISTEWDTPGDPDLNALIAPDTTNDAAVLQFDFVPTASSVSFKYVFGSDEYNEFINSFNDVFGFFINGVNCGTVGNPPQPVTIDDINGSVNPSLYRNNDPSDPGQPSIDTQLDGLTTVLTCVSAVQPNVINHVKLAVADAQDTAVDTSVLLQAGSFTTAVGPTAGGCAPFSDVNGTNPFCPEIATTSAQGVVRGFPDGSFHPGATVSRQAIASFLYNLAHRDEAASCSSAPFSDVAKTNPFCPQISGLVKAHVLSGYSDGSFHPSAGVSRQAMASFLYRLINPGKAVPSCTKAAFTDVPASNEFCGAIQWLVSKGIADGYDNHTFQPESIVSRQAAAAFLYRAGFVH
ncbi:choice-of-anchor L domain-containing protein [uncultured Jatrophihabitans sp.]|uniref:choice-of-anchor L domain-containing protein n=1 Tax=uncultured Jatrophihabitans sp. TaxID=1610747 RepID=UPI0035CC3F08